jgi:hypothetical protein
MTTRQELLDMESALREKASCRGYPLSYRKAYWLTGLSEEISDDAKKICDACPVKIQCLEYAMALEVDYHRFDIFGGLTPIERRRLGKERRAVKTKPKKVCACGCGTPFVDLGPDRRAMYASKECQMRALNSARKKLKACGNCGTLFDALTTKNGKRSGVIRRYCSEECRCEAMSKKMTRAAT